MFIRLESASTNAIYIYLTTLIDLQPERIVLHIYRIRQYSRLIVGSVKRQAQNNLILTLLQQFGIKLKFVSNVVAAHGGAHSTRAALVVSSNC